MRIAKIKLLDGRIIISRVHQVKKNVISTVFGTFKWDEEDKCWLSVTMPGVTAKVESNYFKYTLLPKILNILKLMLLHKRYGLFIHLITIFWLILLICLVLVYCFLFADRYVGIIAKTFALIGAIYFSYKGLPIDVGICLLWIVVILLTENKNKSCV